MAMLGGVWVVLGLFSVVFPGALAFNHWVITEEGKIEYQLVSPFNLRQPFDLLAFMQQEERVSILKELKDELIDYKNEFDAFDSYESFDASFRAQDPECRHVQRLTSFDLYISTVLPLEHKGVSFLDHLDLSSTSLPGEPSCFPYPLEFSMAALEHLEGVRDRRSLVAPPEKSVLASMDMRMEVFGSLVHHALEKNSTSWVLMDLATLYWRARGKPYHAVECIRRALHYSPSDSMDIALLNLANVLHRSQHSSDAAIALQTAISMAPDVNVLHYTLGNVYATLALLNKSVESYRLSLALESSSTTVQSVYKAALCEMKMEAASREHSRRLKDTRKKLDLFYDKMDLVQKNQFAPDGEGLYHPFRAPATLKLDLPTADPADQKQKQEDSSTSSKSDRKTNDTEKHNANLEDDDAPRPNNTRDEFTLEQALDDAALKLNTTDHSSDDEEPGVAERTGKVEPKQAAVEEKRSKVRLIITQDESSCVSCSGCPRRSEVTTDVAMDADSEAEERMNTTTDKDFLHTSFLVSEQCPVFHFYDPNFSPLSRPLENCELDQHDAPLVQEQSNGAHLIQPETDNREHGEESIRGGRELTNDSDCAPGRPVDSAPSHECSRSQPFQPHDTEIEASEREVNMDKNQEVLSGNRHRPRIVITQGDGACTEEELDSRGEKPQSSEKIPNLDGPALTIVGDANLESEEQNAGRVDQKSLAADTGYSEVYRNVEFLPYSPLPEELEEVIFPDRSSPLAPYDDPFWPSKAECVKLVMSLRNVQNAAGLTGTFLTPEARGADLKKLFSSVPLTLSSFMRQKPRCTDIVELPYSMAAMDHLHPMMYRTTLRVNEEAAETGLRNVLMDTVASSSVEGSFTFDESAERVYAAMLKNGPNWALFNIAALYWRVTGDPHNSIECLRRAVHFSPNGAKDVGYIGLANVLHQSGFLGEAVISARAALDINGDSPIAHYTLASIYLSLKDYVATSLHLRAALHSQPQFEHAFSALKLIRCSLKFKQEQQYLQRQVVAAQKELLRHQQEAQITRDLDKVLEHVQTTQRKTRIPAVISRPPAERLTDKDLLGASIHNPFVGEDAIRYLTTIALFQRKRRREIEEEKKVREEQRAVEGEVQGEEEEDEVEEVNGVVNVGEEAGKEEKEGEEEEEEGEEDEVEEVNGVVNVGEEAGKEEKEGEVEEEEKEEEGEEAGKEDDEGKEEGEEEESVELGKEEVEEDRGGRVKESTATELQSETLPVDQDQSDIDTDLTHPIDSSHIHDQPQVNSTDDKLITVTKEATPSAPSSHLSNQEDRGKNTKSAEFETHLNPPSDTTELLDQIDQLLSDSAKEINQNKSPVPRKVATRIKTREDIREEEIKKRFPGYRPWPSLEDCQGNPLPKYIVFTSTWLSVTAKGVNISDHIDFQSPLEQYPQLPYCHTDFRNSPKTLDHLKGMLGPSLSQRYKSEKGLQEVLCNLEGSHRSLDEMATRIKLAMDKNSTSWVLSNLAALFWRIAGQGELAVKCLRHALYYSDEADKDVALVSLANVLFRLGYKRDATAVMHISLEAAPTLVVNHFTLANVYAAQGYWAEAGGFYESTLHYQPQFEPAAERLTTVRCVILIARQQQQQQPQVQRRQKSKRR